MKLWRTIVHAKNIRLLLMGFHRPDTPPEQKMTGHMASPQMKSGGRVHQVRPDTAAPQHRTTGQDDRTGRQDRTSGQDVRAFLLKRP